MSSDRRDDPAESWTRQLARDLADIEGTHMPFGRYGPKLFPPRGIPIYDLPFEYLAWFAKTGFPKGRLGELLQVVYAIKRDGADRAFAPLRERRGGRARLR